MPTHEFRCRLVWTGAALGPTESYRAYDRAYRIEYDGKPAIDGSAAAPFRGDPKKTNPEDLLLGALSACHCLSYLAHCARRNVVVTGYEDSAVGLLAPDREGTLAFQEVTLEPRVTIAEASSVEEARQLHGPANRDCFIARSVAFPVHHRPTIVREGSSGA
ncbi:MAG: OsmC family protein [Myxococcota bacterium]